MFQAAEVRHKIHAAASAPFNFMDFRVFLNNYDYITKKQEINAFMSKPLPLLSFFHPFA